MIGGHAGKIYALKVGASVRVAGILVLKLNKLRHVDRDGGQTVCVLSVARNQNVDGSAEKELWKSTYKKASLAGRKRGGIVAVCVNEDHFSYTRITDLVLLDTSRELFGRERGEEIEDVWMMSVCEDGGGLIWVEGSLCVFFGV